MNRLKRLVLLGGGHAHVHVLNALSKNRLPNVSITLISPFDRQVYSGMLPGWIAGHYDIEQCVLPLKPLARAADAHYLQTAATKIDATRKQILCANGDLVEFDVLSIDIGSAPQYAAIVGAADHAIAIRPIETFIEHMTTLVEVRQRRATPMHITVIGAGAGGVEVALALKHRRAELQVSLVSGANTLPGNIAPRIANALNRAGVAVFAGSPAIEIGPNNVTLADDRVIESEQTIVALGASAPSWLAMTGLACDPSAYLVTNNFLQSISHEFVFAAGDCASIEAYPRPKSGVYAVRAGPPLEQNLRAALTSRPLTRYVPQTRSLYLISTGNKYAIGSWGRVSWEGEWVWRWKDRIDRTFMAKYRKPGANRPIL
jgi:pyridine nucleotide-disulfide oxidoreductase family protein